MQDLIEAGSNAGVACRPTLPWRNTAAFHHFVTPSFHHSIAPTLHHSTFPYRRRVPNSLSLVNRCAVLPATTPAPDPRWPLRVAPRSRAPPGVCSSRWQIAAPALSAAAGRPSSPPSSPAARVKGDGLLRVGPES